MKMLKGKAVTAKSIRINIKNHWTLEDFIQNYGITEETFWQLIKELFHGDATEVRRQLKNNRKQSERKPSQKVEIPASNELLDETIQVEQRGEKKSEMEEKVEASETLDDQENIEKMRELLKAEQEKAESARQEIIALELTHESLVARKRDIQTNELPTLKKLLEEYKQKILEAQSLVISFNNELNEVVAKMEDINATLSEKREELQTLEDEINALKTVNIFVYNTGEIEISASTEVRIPEDSEVDWVSIVTNNGEQCKSMTIAQIQSVAKTLKIVKEMESWQIAFEDDACKKLFDSLM